ncbi:FAD-binding oxidoreductase [Pontiella agarivorans]|uniref:FAD-binding oxidoreductase n=1 Tax=Pontiella agarivorans TaxID=3038953 RepID=A0ABU5MVD3_9BACT|nr:FAD-binding oxidoreductase [Pontiella agarivorans]MDZ8118051.1 FAD-binding oxidoreductase [Pontiella agarivorans]
MSVHSAIEAWEAQLGADAVIHDIQALEKYTRSVCASERQVVAVLKPVSHEQVEQIIEAANAHRVPLYPISRGKQWGMGSKLPVRDGVAIVDLSGLDRILEINEQFHYAVVEPGVTQRQLLDHIAENQLDLMLNVTGSTSDTSLIGNAMDRGVGYFDTRAHGISNMRIVLGNGATIQTGFGHFEHAQTQNLYRHGVGPSLDGLFPQGNFGIVTSACIDLMPKPEEHLAVIVKIDVEEKLPLLVDTLKALRSRGIFTTIAHIGNRERSYITLAPLLYEQLLKNGEPESEATRSKTIRLLEDGGFGPWSAAIGVLGTKAQLKLARRELKKAFSGFAKTMFLNDALVASAEKYLSKFSFFPALKTQLMMLRAVKPVYGYTGGRATDKSLCSVFWAAGDFQRLEEPNPDDSDSGILFCLPIFPASGKEVAEGVEETRKIFSAHGFEAAITVNLMDTKAMEGVVSLSFNRTDKKQTARAQACIQAMETRYMEMGYPPYRVGINSMHQVVHENDPFWQTIRDLKSALDPNGIIAPGRYNLI